MGYGAIVFGTPPKRPHRNGFVVVTQAAMLSNEWESTRSGSEFATPKPTKWGLSITLTIWSGWKSEEWNWCVREDSTTKISRKPKESCCRSSRHNAAIY